MLFRRLKKSKSLRMVNLIGLTVIFSSILLSVTYLKKEQSYDRFHTHADRIFRYAIQVNHESPDGRINGFSKKHPSVANIPQIEDMVLFTRINVGMMQHKEKKQIIHNFLFASSNFFEVFSFKLIEGDKRTVLDAPEKAVISQRYAQMLFGNESPLGKEIDLSGRKFANKKVFISGVYEDFPETSHFRTDLIVHLPDIEEDWTYVYLLLNNKNDIQAVNQAIAANWEQMMKDNPSEKITPYILPLKDIHLHSRLLRELDINGNIHYLYLIVGANLLLLTIVLFNLWLNTSLIFSFNQKYYQLLRLNGASWTSVIKDESILAFILAISALLLGGIACLAFPGIHITAILSASEIIGLSLLFLVLVMGVSLVPVITNLSATTFLNTENSQRTYGFKLSSVKYMLIAQFAMVMFIVIVGLGVSRQIDCIRNSQVGGKESNILVMEEQPEEVKERFDVLKAELLKHPEIMGITSSMQLPGSAIRDRIAIHKEGESKEQAQWLPIHVVGNDFLPFFQIKPVAGTVFQPNHRSYKEEMSMVQNYIDHQTLTGLTEEYVINRKAMQALGFKTPEEAIGKLIHLSGSLIEYIDKGIIVGVTEDFNYASTFEKSAPQILMQRNAFLHCIMVRLSPTHTQEAMQTFNQVWNKVYPDYPADYTFLDQVYHDIYQNEFQAETLTSLFSLLCLIIANMGLIIIMAFIIKRKTKEIGIRKVNGATPFNIIQMLNSRFIHWICIAFVIAIPGAYWVMKRWLENFAYKTPLDGWIFAMAGLSVLTLSILLITWQSWRAANLNPIKAIKTE